jgi:hypothetical protein
MVSPGAAILLQRDESLSPSRTGNRGEEIYRQRMRSPTAWTRAGHTTRIQLLQFTRRALPSDSQHVHNKLVPVAHGDGMRVSSEFHSYFVGEEENTNRHDPTFSM